jgi:hypothetical protein
LMVEGTDCLGVAAARRLPQALDCLRPSKVHPDWIR